MKKQTNTLKSNYSRPPLKGKPSKHSDWSILAILLSFTFLTSFAPSPDLKDRQTAAIDKSKFKVKSKIEFKNWGLNNSHSNSHIDILEAWKIEEGSRNVTIAVIDTGVDPNHQDLKGNIWKDKKIRKTATSKKTLKGKSSAAPIFGWDFVTNTKNPIDVHGHGTHVAGIIGAISNPKEGISGVTHRTSIMAIRYYSESNSGAVNLSNTIRAINYAVENGAKIINYSGGGPEFSEEEYYAIKNAEAHGVLFIAAAGNETHDTDLVENYYYPSAYRTPNILSVTATDINNKLLKSSNWGKTKVDVAAPGENIYSTLPGNKYGYMSGTSQATAFVTGLAALLLSKNPSLSPTEVRKIIIHSVDKLPTLTGKITSEGRVNAYQALVALANFEKDKRFKKNPTLLDKMVFEPQSILDLLLAQY